MLIPFSAPRIPELNHLPDDDRQELMRRFATSTEVRRLLLRFKITAIASVVLLISPVLVTNAIGFIFCGLGLALFIYSIVSYQSSASRVLRFLYEHDYRKR